jgi:tetratricopeptide (TPR) repeat protein
VDAADEVRAWPDGARPSQLIHVLTDLGAWTVNGDEIRARVTRGDLTHDAAIPLVEQALAEAPTMELWLLRGRLIQLSDQQGYSLQDAAHSFQEAAACAPEDPEPLEELGHFYDAVMDDLPAAEQHFRQALQLGAGSACAEALQEVIRQREDSPERQDEGTPQDGGPTTR